MFWLIIASVPGLLGLLAALICEGSRRLESSEKAAVLPPEAPWPRVSLIVPVAGRAEGLDVELTSLLAQDYPDFEVWVVTAATDEPVVRVIRELMGRYPRLRHLVSGPAWGCGQKNHNLRAGLKMADPRAAIVAFCDRGRLAAPDFLRHLVAPLLQGAAVASGYHYLMPTGRSLPAQARAAAVLILRLTREFPPLMQPWGGAVAMTRKACTRLGVAEVWGWTAVDDVSLGARLKRLGVPVVHAPGAMLLTPVPPETWREAARWLTRQWLYLKYYLPGTWLAAGLLVHLFLALTLWACLSLLWAPVGGVSLLSLLALGYLGGLVTLCRRLERLPAAALTGAKGIRVWLGALVLASLSHLVTCLSHTLRWHGLEYRVGLGGRVLGVRRPAAGDPGGMGKGKGASAGSATGPPQV